MKAFKRPARAKASPSILVFDPDKKTQSSRNIQNALALQSDSTTMKDRVQKSVPSSSMVSSAMPLRDSNASKRLKTYGEQYQPQGARTGRLSVCEIIKVAPQTLNQYTALLTELEDWRKQEKIPAPLSPACVILTFLDYVDAQFFSGLSHADSSKTWAAIQKLIPSVLKEADLCRRARNALDGFSKRAPAESREPAPEEIYFAIIGNMLWKDQIIPALNETLRYLSMCRPGEIDLLLVKQLVPPVGKHRLWSILLAIQEEKRPGKTGEYDEGVVLDQVLATNLHRTFVELTAGRSPEERLWQCEPHILQSAFNQSVTDLQLDHLHITRYGSRHSAASHDLYHRLRTFNETKERGRWKSDHSMRRYSKAARLQYFTNKVHPDVLKYGEMVKTELPKLFRGLKISPPKRR